MKLEEAIKTAIEYENRVHAVYAEAEKTATDPVGKRIFGVLAREELGHVAYLNACLDSWKKTGRVAPEPLKTAVPPQPRIEQGLAQMKGQVTKKREQPSHEVDLLQRAVEAEQTTSSFYKKVVGELDPEGQRLFARFVEIEEGHLAIVRAELDSVTGVGFWFDVPEWQFPDG